MKTYILFYFSVHKKFNKLFSFFLTFESKFVYFLLTYFKKNKKEIAVLCLL